MNNRALSAICLAVAVVAAAVSAIVVTNNRATIARARAAKAESEEGKASSEAKKAKAEESAELARKAQKEADAKAAEENRKAKELERKTAEAQAVAEKEAKERASLEAEKARAEAQAAADARAEAKAKSEAAKAQLEKARVTEQAEIVKSNALAQAAADRLATTKLKTDAAIAESKLLENRKIDFETWQARLLELDQDLAERERALKPDLTIYDSTNITWVAEREADVIGSETNAAWRIRKQKVEPENDLTLPEATRRLAKAERELKETLAGDLSVASNKVITSLTRLYVEALRDGRIVDAHFYRQSIKHYYPNWEYKP